MAAIVAIIQNNGKSPQTTGSTGKTADDQGSVLAAETETIAQAMIHHGLASLIRDIIKVALRVRVLIIHRGR